MVDCLSPGCARERSFAVGDLATFYGGSRTLDREVTMLLHCRLQVVATLHAAGSAPMPHTQNSRWRHATSVRKTASGDNDHEDQVIA
jgi:hypothetical protein